MQNSVSHMHYKIDGNGVSRINNANMNRLVGSFEQHASYFNFYRGGIDQPISVDTTANMNEGPNRGTSSLAHKMFEMLGLAKRVYRVQDSALKKGLDMAATFTALMAYRTGDVIKVFGGHSHVVATMIKQKRHFIHPRMVIIYAKTKGRHYQGELVPREFTPNELSSVRSIALSKGAMALYEEMSRVTGFRTTISGLGSAHDTYSEAFSNLYGEVDMDDLIAEDVVVHLVGDAVRSSQERIHDQAIIARIVDISSSSHRSSFLYAASGSNLLLINMNMDQGSHDLQVVTFDIKQDGLPVGAFATSTGAWHIESHGSGGTNPIQNLLNIFAPLK